MSKSSGHCDSLKAKEHTSPNAFAGSLHVWSEQCRVYCCKGDWGLFFWQTEQLCTEVLPNRRNSVALVVSPILRRNGFWRPQLLGGHFALLGGLIAMTIWRELPVATRRYIADVEQQARTAQSSNLTSSPLEMD